MSVDGLVREGGLVMAGGVVGDVVAVKTVVGPDGVGVVPVVLEDGEVEGEGVPVGGAWLRGERWSGWKGRTG